MSFDPNARPVFTPDVEQAWADVRETAAAARLVKMSDEDLEFLQPGMTAEGLARTLLGGRTQLVVVTYGGEGAVALMRGLKRAIDPAGLMNPGKIFADAAGAAR